MGYTYLYGELNMYKIHNNNSKLQYDHVSRHSDKYVCILHCII